MGSEAQEEREAQRKMKDKRSAKDFMRGFYQNPSALSGGTALFCSAVKASARRKNLLAKP
jgi:hypothetical protein